MEPYQSTTPFGRRPLSLAMMAAQASAKACPDDAAAQKWKVFRHLTEAKSRLGLGDRALAVLSALLTFHPDTALTPGGDLVVFPSNRELTVRAHGLAPTTLRRALSELVEGGIVIRRDSPNGKRYARRGEGGAIAHAFGFDLTPLVSRASEFEQLADAVRAEAKARQLLREEISLHRRDVAKTIAFAFEQALPGPWAELAERFRAMGGMPARSAEHDLLAALAIELRAVRLDVDKCLEEALEFTNLDANESQGGCHHQNSKPKTHSESEPRLPKGKAAAKATPPEPARSPQRIYPLGMVLKACPDIAMYARDGIGNWADLGRTADLVRRTLGVSPSAWDEAKGTLGEEAACVVVACILQKGATINSAGAYLRKLTELAKTGRFSLGPMLMAAMRASTGEGDRMRA